MACDLVGYACERAVRRFGAEHDRVFNSACFAEAFSDITGLRPLSGRVVEAILWGRGDVYPLYGGSHWQLAEHPRMEANLDPVAECGGPTPTEER